MHLYQSRTATREGGEYDPAQQLPRALATGQHLMAAAAAQRPVAAAAAHRPVAAATAQALETLAAFSTQQWQRQSRLSGRYSAFGSRGSMSLTAQWFLPSYQCLINPSTALEAHCTACCCGMRSILWYVPRGLCSSKADH